MATVLFSTGCMMSRLVDRAFLGITVRRPAYLDRKTTGVFLLPFTFVIDVAPSPSRRCWWSSWATTSLERPGRHPAERARHARHPAFHQLGEEQQAIAIAELKQLVLDKKLTPNTALALGEDGHWTLVELSADTRNQLIARAQQPRRPKRWSASADQTLAVRKAKVSFQQRSA